MQVVVKDGRELTGELLCLDKQGNLILGNTYEQVPRQGLAIASASQLIMQGSCITFACQCSDKEDKERPIGQVLVPAQHQKSCHVEVSTLCIQQLDQHAITIIPLNRA